MGDVDFLIRAEDRQKSDEVLKSIGFEFVEKNQGQVSGTILKAMFCWKSILLLFINSFSWV